MLPGEYAVGWIKRGPSGVIGTNKKDAQQTVDALLEDLAADRHLQPAEPDPEAIERLLAERVPALVTYEGWSEIDRHEQSLGEPHGRPRVKLTRIERAAARGRRGEPGGRAAGHARPALSDHRRLRVRRHRRGNPRPPSHLAH